MAHELAHVVQHDATPGAQPVLRGDFDLRRCQRVAPNAPHRTGIRRQRDGTIVRIYDVRVPYSSDPVVFRDNVLCALRFVTVSRSDPAGRGTRTEHLVDAGNGVSGAHGAHTGTDEGDPVSVTAEVLYRPGSHGLVAQRIDFPFTPPIPEPSPGPDDQPETEEPDEEEATPSAICGPEVTEAVRGALRDMETWYAGLSDLEKRAHCNRLHHPLLGLAAWDISLLYCENGAWIDVFTRRGICATPGNHAAEPCEEPATSCRHSVRFGGRCVLAGTLNYLMWGQMHRLCNRYARSPANRWAGALSPPIAANGWNRGNMEFFINLYKGWGAVEDPSGPLGMARASFSAGAGAAPTVANRSHCTGECPERFARTRPFHFVWRPGHV